MKNRDSSILYFLLGIYTLMVSWHYNHDSQYRWIILILTYLFWPVYLIYELLIGHLSHGLWKEIPQSFFK